MTNAATTDPSQQASFSTEREAVNALPGRYNVIRELARGGMSAVYLADDLDVDRRVALKISTLSGTGDKSVQRFHREARAIQRLQHPNIVKIFDSFPHGDDRHVLALEYIDGGTLAQRLRDDGPLGLREFTPIASQIVKALEYAHARSTIIRDIKPDNVMLCEQDGRRDVVKLIDFGLARALNLNDQVTQDDAIAGTIGFMSPEEVSGSSPVDTRSDVYALGATFFYMLSGKRMFDGSPASMLFQQTSKEALPLASVLPSGHDLPAPLLELVDACVRRNPDERPESAVEVMGGLIDAVPASAFRLRKTTTPRAASSSIAAAPALATQPFATSEHPAQPRGRLTRIAGFVAVGVVLLAGTFALGMAMRGDSKRANPPMEGVANARPAAAAAEAESDAPSQPEPAGADTRPAVGAPTPVDPAKAKVEQMDPTPSVGQAPDPEPVETPPKEVAATPGPGTKAKARASAAAKKQKLQTAKEETAKGKALVASGKAKFAAESFAAALEAKPGYAPALAGMSDAMFERGDYETALSYAQKAAKASPRNGGYQIKLGDAYYKVKRNAEAEKAYERAKSLGHPKAEKRLAKFGG